MRQLSSYPLVSIIVLNYNGLDVVESCIRSVLATNYPNFEIIIVDNASVDGSYQTVMKKFGKDSRVTIIRNSVNLGFAGGNNIGLKYARGSYITLLNNDTEVDYYWLLEAIKIAESNEKIGAIQSKLFFWYNRNILESAGAFIDKAGYGFEKGFVKGKQNYNAVEDIFYANGAAVTLKKDAIERIQEPGKFELFDQDFFFAYEDVDLSWRMRLAGFRTVISPKSIVYHRRSTTTSRKKDLLVFHHCKNRILTLVKNYNLSNLARYLPLLLILESMRAVSNIAGRRDSSSRAIFRAYLWSLMHFRQSWRKRLVVQYVVRRVPEEQVVGLMKNLNPASLIYNQRLYQQFSKATGVNIIR